MRNFYVINNDNGKEIMEGLNTEEKIDYIIKCMDVHDDMVKTLKRCVNLLQVNIIMNKNYQFDQDAINQATSVLQRAGAI